MNLIPGVVLILGVIAIVGLLGLDTFKNRKVITKADIQQSSMAKLSKPKPRRLGLFNRG
tara:strand:+ start:1727 stop:1903 length:177 start_codon:yes stop_codon:yes gene_type:complete